jgi:RHS repeat-associated protein
MRASFNKMTDARQNHGAFKFTNSDGQRTLIRMAGKHSRPLWVALLLFTHGCLGTTPIYADEKASPMKIAETTAAPNRVVPPHSAPTVGFSIPDQPTEDDIKHVRLFAEPLLPVGGKPSAEQNRQLAAVLLRHSRRAMADDFSELEQFVAAYPDSPWTPSLLFNMGLEYYKTGWYSKALGAWEKSWAQLKPAADPAVKAVADRAVGELAGMYARVGRMKELSDLLDSIKSRTLLGPGSDKVNRATQGLWTMQNNPEIAFRCGPMALDRIIAFKNPGKGGQLLIQNSSSTTNGFSLTQVAALSQKAGLNYQMAFRNRGAPLLMPAVVHWKVGHYAALLQEKNGLYLLQDPTFRNDAWVTASALEEETTGYFLVPPGNLPKGWRTVGEAEGMTVWGKGTTSFSDPNDVTPNDRRTCFGSGSRGMAVHSVFLLDVSLNIQDTPVGYAPPIGPAVQFVVNYNQRESDQPATFDYSNLGAQWTFNYLAYISDDPSAPEDNVNYYTDGGGTLPFTGFNAASQSFAPQMKSHAILTRTSSNSYAMLFPDGSSYLFALPGSASANSRVVFLTQIIDPQGNSVQITYDGSFRVVALTDAIGQVTTLSYQNTNDSLKITQVTDPFGRFATFNYDASNRLSQITDCIGLTSQFTYDSGDNILAMTTPYGTTSFAFGQFGRDTWLQTTYPDGEKDRVEYTESTTVGADSQDPASTLPQGMWTRDWVMYARDTYFWDRNAYWAYAANTNVYTNAHNYHWLHDPTLTIAMGILESEKQPLENRVWNNYPGQPPGDYYATIIGTSDQPDVIGRVLDDGTTQLRKFGYNALGHVTNSIDPLGRSMTYIYASNLVDMVEVHQTTGTNNDLVASAQYNSTHLPIAIYDAARQLTTNTYNGRGQILSTTDPMGATTTFIYGTNGYLLAINGPLQTTNDITEFSYDTFGRIRTLTLTDGYTLTYAYDNLDRVTSIVYPDGTSEAFTYNKLDMVAAQDRLGRQTLFTYDSLRRLVAIQDPLNRSTQFDYCGCGSLATLLDPMGRMTSWEHDVQGRLIGKQYADGSRVAYNYENTTSRLKSVIDEHGQWKLHSYNIDDTLSSVSYPNAIVATPAVTYTYDPNYSRLTSMQDGIGTTAYSYIPITGAPALGAGAVQSVNGPLPNSTVTYQYDQLGRVSSRAINGVAQAVTFDVLGRPINMTNALGAFNYAYVGATARLASEAYPNGQTNLYTYYNNVGDRRLAQIQHLTLGGVLLSAVGYSYNAAGLITAWSNQWDTVPARVWLPAYDAADQVTNVASAGGPSTVTNYAYAYDTSGNRVLALTNGQDSSFLYNSLNQLVSTTPGAATNLTYEWDAENRLTAINNGINRSEFSYDGSGHRVRIVEKVNGAMVTNTTYLWCDGQICEVRDVTGGVTLRRLYSQGESVIEAGGSTNYYFAEDHLGSVCETTSSDGVLSSRYDYDPYGRQTVVQQGFSPTFGYTGLFTHSPSGLSLAMFRALDSGAGRWLSRDPVGEFAGPNVYAYVANNPVNRVDQLGLYFGIDDLVFTAGGALVGLGGQFVGDVISSARAGSWQFSGWEDYAGSAVGGAVGGEALLYTGPIGAGLAGGAAGNLAKQGFKNLSGKQCGFDLASFGFDTAVGGLTGFIPGAKVPGITSGRGSYNQVFKQISTKAQNGTISSITSTTAGKMFVGRSVDTALVPGTGAAALAGASGLVPSSEDACPCKK